MRHHTDLGIATDWLKICFNLASFNQSETLPRSVTSMEFLQSLVRCHFEGKPVVASPNVRCFLRITILSVIMHSSPCWGADHGRSTKNVCLDARLLSRGYCPQQNNKLIELFNIPMLFILFLQLLFHSFDDSL